MSYCNGLKNPKMIKQGTDGKMKHVTIMIPDKPEIKARNESSKRKREVLASYSIGLSIVNDTKNQRD
jgi:hypothetical protein